MIVCRPGPRGVVGRWTPIAREAPPVGRSTRMRNAETLRAERRERCLRTRTRSVWPAQPSASLSLREPRVRFRGIGAALDCGRDPVSRSQNHGSRSQPTGETRAPRVARRRRVRRLHRPPAAVRSALGRPRRPPLASPGPGSPRASPGGDSADSAKLIRARRRRTLTPEMARQRSARTAYRATSASSSPSSADPALLLGS